MTRLPPQLRSTIVYLGTIVMAQLASFMLLPVVTRFLGPAQFGEYALALAVASLVGMTGSTWIRNVAFRFYFDARVDGTTRPFFWSVAALQAVVLTVAFGVTIVLLPLVSSDLVPMTTLLAAACMIFASDFQALAVSFIRAEQMSGRFAVAEIAAAVTRLVGTAIGLALGFVHPVFLFLAAAFASLVGGAIALIALRARLVGPATLDARTMWSVLQRAPGALPFSLGQWFGRLADRLVLNAYASTAVVGTYSAGYSLSDRIANGLGDAVFMMSWPDVLKAWSEGGVAAARVAVRRYFQIFLWLTVGPVVALVIFADPFVAFMLGDGYAEAALVVGLVAVAAWTRGIIGGLNRHFELQKRFYALSLMTIGGAAVHLVLNLVLVPQYLAVGAGIAYLSAQVLLMLVAIVIRDRELVWFPWPDALHVGVVSLVAAVLVVVAVGVSMPGLVTFAVAYSIATAAVWRGRLRRGWVGGS